MKSTTASLRNMLQRSISNSKRTRKFRSFNSENTNPNTTSDPPLSPSIPTSKLPKTKLLTWVSDTTTTGIETDDNLPQNPQLEENVGADNQSEAADLTKEEVSDSLSQRDMEVVSDPAVKVVVRIRPASDHEQIGDVTAKAHSSDTVSVGDRKFTFDTVLNCKATQEDVFNSVGMPLVTSALSGYNGSIVSCGQTGSGKTYTMWGPPSAMVEDPSPSSHQGIVPRIFQVLFSKIQGIREQENVNGKQINFQCRCSFLEVYNEQISDLLDPVQRNLEIRDDPKNGLSVENLSEEYVNSYEDVTQVLIKGLSNRKVGATSQNSKSSRSHVVFIFVIESWCKGTSSKCFGSSKISRISLVDLAGLDSNKPDDPNRQLKKEGKSVKKSLSQFGQLVNILANGTKSGDSHEALYEGSCLTHLLKESFGGNAKLTVICNISPDNRNNAETLGTLRFGQRVKCIKNNPVVNEISEDDVNDLSDQIRQLKEELIRARFDTDKSVETKSGYFRGLNTRESLNHLRQSINRSLMLPCIDNEDSDNELNINENDVKELHQQIDSSFSEENNTRELSDDHKDTTLYCSVDQSFETDLMSEDGEVNGPVEVETGAITADDKNSGDISISVCHQSPTLLEPTLSDSPKIGNNRKSVAFSSSIPNMVSESRNNKSDLVLQSIRQSQQSRSSSRSSRALHDPTESLAASLQRGLQIIDSHQRNSTLNRSSVSFSFEHLALQPCTEGDSINRASIMGRSVSSLLCASCKQKINDDEVPCDGDDGKRMKDLETVCKEQAAHIEQLNLLVEQYKKVENNKLEVIKENCEENCNSDEANEKEALLEEIKTLRAKLQSYSDEPANKSTEKLRSSLLLQSIQLRKSMDGRISNSTPTKEELEEERQRWTEMESEWISLTDDLRIDLESSRRHAEKLEAELNVEKQCTLELDDALGRAVLGHARMVEHYADLQEKHNELVSKHRAIMQSIAEVKKAAAKAKGKKGGSRFFAKSLASELSAMRVEREREMELLKKENKNLKVQLRDTAEAVHAAGELLVRLREAEQAASAAEENFTRVQEEKDKLKKQVEKLKRKHKMEMVTMKQYMAESRLPESALQPLYRAESTELSTAPNNDHDDEAWRAEFGAIYQEHF